MTAPSGHMHDDEMVLDEALARRLVEDQFPAGAKLPLLRVTSSGTSHAIFRLGDELAVRLPLYPGADGQALSDARWLPVLAPRLPLAVPVPAATGLPASGYPWHWSVVPWFRGDTAALDRLRDVREAARDLGRFVVAMRELDLPAGPPPERSDRGGPLAPRDAYVQSALADLRGEIDVRRAASVWERALLAPTWQGRPMWLHGDLHEGNLIATDGRLSAVIDWGCLAVGDPAPDVMAAWTYLPQEGRGVFRDVVQPDDATWERARGWALSMGLIALPYYLETNPAFADLARRIIDRTLADPS